MTGPDDAVDRAAVVEDRLQPRVRDHVAIAIDRPRVRPGGLINDRLEGAAIQHQGIESAVPAVDQSAQAATLCEHERIFVVGVPRQVFDGKEVNDTRAA